MANAGSINYEFTASVADLEQKAVIAQKIIEEKVAKQIDSVGTKSTVSDKKIVGMFKNIAKEGRAVSPMLGKIGVAIASIDAVVVPLYRSFETFFARMQPGLERMGRSLLAFVTTPVGMAVAAVAALSAAAIALYAVFGQAGSKAKAYADAMKVVQKANEEMRESIRIGTLSAALDRDQAAWFKAKIDGYSKALKVGADELQKITKANEFEIASILQGKSDFPKRQPLVQQWDPWTGEDVTRKSDTDVADERRDELVAQLRNQQKLLDSYTKQLAYLEEAEANAAEAAKERAAAAEKAAADSIRDQEAKAKAAENAAAKELAAAERVEEQAQAHAQREAERSAAEEQAIRDRLDVEKVAQEQVMQSKFAFTDWAASLQANMADVYQGIQNISTQAIGGIGDAFARAVVYGESFVDMMDQLWKSLAAGAISTIFQIALQQLLALALVQLGVVTAGAARLGVEFAVGAAAMMASVFAAVPFPANLIAAPAMAKVAMGMMAGQAAAAATVGQGLGLGLAVPIPGLARGGIATGAMLAVIGEGGEHELIAPRSDYEKLFEDRKASGDIAIYLDGRELTHSVARHLPGVVRQRGVKGL